MLWFVSCHTSISKTCRMDTDIKEDDYQWIMTELSVTLLKELYCRVLLKGTVHLKMKILSLTSFQTSMTLSSVTHKRRYFEERWGLTTMDPIDFNCIVVKNTLKYSSEYHLCHQGWSNMRETILIFCWTVPLRSGRKHFVLIVMWLLNVLSGSKWLSFMGKLSPLVLKRRWNKCF